MGFWANLFGTASTPTLLPSSPYNPDPSTLVQLTIKELYGDIDPTVVTRDIALRVPALKRAHNIHCGIVASIIFKQYEGDVLDAVQPEWLYRTDTKVSPYHRAFGVASDMFMYGWGLIGAEAGDDGLPRDGLHIPQGYWSIDSVTGEISIDDRIPKQYHEIPIAIPLGAAGILTDGIDTIRAARQIEAAWQDRIENPIPQTELHYTDDTVTSRKEKRQLAADYAEGRKVPGGAVSVTPFNIETKIHGQIPTDLFESGRNAVRLDIANHAMVPASIIEGAKNGSAGEINYSNETGKRDELYDFGTGLFVNAINARLSMDDVTPVGKSIRGDLSSLMAVPTPLTSAPTED